MNGFDVSAAELQAASSMLDEVAGEVRSQVTKLRGEVEGLLSAGWRSQAASGFTQGWRQWEQGADDVLAALSMMAELLGDSGRNYATAEDASTQSAARTETLL